MKVAIFMMTALILIIPEGLLAQTATESLEVPLYSNEKTDSVIVGDTLGGEADGIDIYTSYQNKKPVFSGKKENKVGIYGILYGEPEKIKLPTIDADNVGIGIGVKLDF